MGRITINGTIRSVSTRSWKISRPVSASQRLCDRDSYVTAEKVRNAFLGMGDDCRLLLQTFDECLERANGDRAYSKHNDYRKRQVTNALSDSMKSGGFVSASCSARPDRDMTATGSPPKVSSRNASKSSDATVRRCGPSPACRSRHSLALPIRSDIHQSNIRQRRLYRLEFLCKGSPFPRACGCISLYFLVSRHKNRRSRRWVCESCA